MEKLLLAIKNLTKSYTIANEKLLVFQGFSLNLPYASTLAITGESGTGKSTLLNLIAGLDQFDNGEILCNSYNIGLLGEKQLAAYRNKSLGFIFQSHFLLKDFTALENITIPALIAGLNTKKAEEQAKALLNQVGLSPRTKHYPDQLSGGERQRVAIARALMNHPNLILADEPTGNLDEKNSELVQELLFNLIKQQQTSLILVTHDKQLASRCVLQCALTKSFAPSV